MKFQAFVALLLVPLTALAGVQALSPAEREEIQQFRELQAKVLQGPQSALGMVSLEKLRDGDTTIGSAAGSRIHLDHVAPNLGVVRLHGEQIEFVPPSGGFPSDLFIGGKPAASGTVVFDAEGTSPTFVEGSVNFVLRHKFGFFLVGRDLRAPELLAFHGLRWYAPDGRYRIVAKWIPYPKPQVLRVANILGQVNEDTSYGVAEFTVNGRTVRLEPSVYQGREKPLFFVFKDRTSRTTTYQGGRFLDARLPDHGLSAPGEVVLDFNQARNPLCAFSAHTSCPIPPESNRMPFAIPAGERRYIER
ncbi:DUF1684 domain-containing protein [Terriglobus roseus]|uniref:DUF1684 domain-containing protein n=1 Tax=Terriglobus roseus TaxID=392734 RepID=A0A1H4LBS2_9BACT|nr:DUF1684 domain-containing protein [Terriglobus roseus]SEB67632.1 hypothetical protein SAMN05443244_1526 [Terriglobus roseus]